MTKSAFGSLESIFRQVFRHSAANRYGAIINEIVDSDALTSETPSDLAATGTPEAPDASKLLQLVDTEAEAFDQEWSALVTRWGDPAAHKKFVFLANSLDRLADAASRYKAIKANALGTETVNYRLPADVAERGSMAELGMTLITQQAIAKFVIAPRETRPRRGGFLIPLSAFAMIVSIGFLLSHATGRTWFISVPMILLYAFVTVIFPWKRIREAAERRAS